MKRLCYCKTCNKIYHYLGIARHRAMHRDRREDCTIVYRDGKECIHEFSNMKKKGIGMYRKCCNCKHEKKGWSQKPCKQCLKDRYSKWESKENV